MRKKNGDRFDSLKKVRKDNVIFKNGDVSVYCNKCGEFSNTDSSTCPKCGSRSVVYTEGD
jgi:uncharacterized OB-fold protein